MARLSAHGEELLRYFDARTGCLYACMADGTRLVRSIGNGWKIRGRKRSDISLEAWLSVKRHAKASQPWWAEKIRSLPSLHTLERWEADGGCETVTGEWCEPDGYGPDGSPSWLVALRLI